MQPLIDFNQSDPYYFKVEEGTTYYAYKALTALRPKAKRIVAIGGRPLLFANLLQAGYFVVHLDHDQDELTAVRENVEEYGGGLVENFSAARRPVSARTEMWLVWISQDDCFFFYETLHHLDNPIDALSRIRQKLGRGWIIILDESIELMRGKWNEYLLEEESTLKELRENARRGLLSAESLAAEEISWRAWEKKLYACRRGMHEVGFYGERSVRSFLARAGMELKNFWYSPSCPCGDVYCNNIMTFWMCAWHTPF